MENTIEDNSVKQIIALVWDNISDVTANQESSCNANIRENSFCLIIREDLMATCHYVIKYYGTQLTFCIGMSEDEYGENRKCPWTEKLQEKLKEILGHFIPKLDCNDKPWSCFTIECNILTQAVLNNEKGMVFYNPALQGGAILKISLRLLAQQS